MFPSIDLTKRLCLCTFTTIILVVLFIISPLSQFFKTSALMKMVAVIILSYSIYLSVFQVNILQHSERIIENPQWNSQLTMNIYCSYTFTFFLSLLLIFILKDLLRI